MAEDGGRRDSDAEHAAHEPEPEPESEPESEPEPESESEPEPPEPEPPEPEPTVATDDAGAADTAQTAPDTRAGDTGETTQIHPVVGPSGTTVMPSVPEPQAAQRPVWSARARVPTPAEPDQEHYEYGQVDEDGYGEPGPLRSRLTPAVIAVCVVLLLAAIGIGGWLIARGLRGNPAPNPPATIRTTTTAPATTPARTAPNTLAPVTVIIGVLTNQDYAVAAGALRAQGLQPARLDEPSNDVAAGKVTRTDPAAGAMVPPGTIVTVYVSSGKPSPTVTTTPSPGPS